MARTPVDFASILAAMNSHSVDFIIIGGVGAALQGAPITTLDLDLAHSRRPENVTRLLNALRELDAYYREQPEKRLKPSASDLAGPGHHLLMTRSGPLDLLGSVSGGRAYDGLLPHTIEMLVAPQTRIRVLDLPMLIRLKEELGRDKDIAMLAVLRRTLKERGTMQGK
jgi:hypothetical protein